MQPQDKSCPKALARSPETAEEGKKSFDSLLQSTRRPPPRCCSCTRTRHAGEDFLDDPDPPYLRQERLVDLLPGCFATHLARPRLLGIGGLLLSGAYTRSWRGYLFDRLATIN